MQCQLCLYQPAPIVAGAPPVAHPPCPNNTAGVVANGIALPAGTHAFSARAADSLLERIESYRRELYRSREEIKSLDTELKHELSSSDRQSKERQRTVLLNEIRRLDDMLEDLSGQHMSKRHCSSFTVTVPGEQVNEVVLWHTEVMAKNVLREVVDVNALLSPPRPLVAELRWLQLKAIAAGRTSLDAIKSMRAGRVNGQRDLEVPYHGPLLVFYEAASRGQIDLQFAAEDHSQAAPREDIRGLIQGVRKVPQECKTEFVYNPGGTDPRASRSIDVNAEAFGKLLQVCRSSCLDAGQACRRLCSFAGRMEYIWFVEFSFAADGQLLQCRVAPRFPSQGQSITDNVLCPLNNIDSCATLADLLDTVPSPGFQLLSRYVDTLAFIHSLPLTVLQLIAEDDSVIDLSQVQILAQGQHSMVLLPSPGSDCVIKISLSSLIDRERRIHALVDGSSNHLRRMAAGSSSYGKVNGAGDGLAFLKLEGVGNPFIASDASSDAAFAHLWEHARAGLAGMHGRRILHRDVKPSNMIIIHGSLLLNDFDVSCSLDDSPAVLQQLQVGTDAYRSPKLQDKWRERDDWLGLVLSFLSLRMPFPFQNKQGALEQALTLSWVPSTMKECIRKCYL